MEEGKAEPKFATADEIGRFSDQLIPEPKAETGPSQMLTS